MTTFLIGYGIICGMIGGLVVETYHCIREQNKQYEKENYEEDTEE